MIGKAEVIVVALVLGFSYTSADVASSRLSVASVKGKGENDVLLAFHLNAGQYRWTSVARNPNHNVAVEWKGLPLPGKLSGIANPVYVFWGSSSILCIQASDGQVYCSAVLPTMVPSFGKWILVGSHLPTDEGVAFKSMDALQVTVVNGQPYIYARSLSKQSKLYWSARSTSGNWSEWQVIGSESISLLTDAAVQYNPFSKLYEVYAVMTDGYMYRAWQTSFSKWVGWTKTGYFAPKTLHAPVAHAMSSSFFNGRINVFVHGTDGYLHQIWQTTCDKVPNPWGWCTWSTWHQIGSKIPATQDVMNTLTAGNNIHQGIEVFATSASGKLYFVWQPERDEKWYGWQAVAASSAFVNRPFVSDDFTGWWTAYGLDASDSVIAVGQRRSFSVTPTSIAYGQAVKVSWNVPQDQATNLDWIGVYPHESSDQDYVDYYYVGGQQNPYKDAVPTGSLIFTSYLPAGTYDYRYLVNRRYVTAVSSSVKVTSGSGDTEWVQVFRGLFNGLQINNVSVATCVKDAEEVVTAFQKSFTYFEDRAIYKGLNALGYALKDVLTAAQGCGILPTIVEGIEKVIKDLISCVHGDCKNFLIDTLKEILILYENIYEIYGDIKGASSSFKYKFYEQGGYCVGRVVHACVTLR